MVTWRELVDEATQVLAADGVAEADITARWIGQRATGADGADWLDTLETNPTKRHVAHFDAMVARRRSGEPLQYVLGRWGFRHLDLYIDRRVLIPRPETEVVAGHAVDEAARQVSSRTEPVTVVDLGTGSGAIGLSVAFEQEQSEVWLTDVSSDAVAVARANLAGLGRAGSRVRIVEGDWFDALPGHLRGRVGVVVSNPPYVDRGDTVDPQIEWEPSGALLAPPGTRTGRKGARHLEHLIERSPAWLTDDGALVLEMAPMQVGAMAELAERRFAAVRKIKDLAGLERGVVARRPLPSQ